MWYIIVQGLKDHGSTTEMEHISLLDRLGSISQSFFMSWHTEKLMLFFGPTIINWKVISLYGLNGKK